MGRRGQAEILAQLGEVGQQPDDAPVVGLEEGLQGQGGEQLVLGEVLAGELRRIGGQNLPRQRSASWATARGDLVIGLLVFIIPLYARPAKDFNRAIIAQN